MHSLLFPSILWTRTATSQSYLGEFTRQGSRPDGRPFSACRPITILPSVLTRNSYGSAMVSLGGGGHGSTHVIAGCTLLVGQPSPSTPNEGDVDVTLAASPLSGPRFDVMGREHGDITSGDYSGLNDDENGKEQQLPGNLSKVISRTHNNNDSANTTPSPTDTKEIESWIRRTLRSSRFIDPTELGIETGVSAWRVRISIHLLNHEGNVWDASLLCACAALSDLRLPMVEMNRGVVKIVKNEVSGGTHLCGRKSKVQRREGRSLTLGPLPVPLTVAILPNDKEKQNSQNLLLVVDPTHLEEDVAAGNTVTVVCNAREEIVDFHKKGSRSRLSVDQVTTVACMGFGRAKELESLVLGLPLPPPQG